MENPLPAKWPKMMHNETSCICMCVCFCACEHNLHETSKLHKTERRTADSLNIYKRAGAKATLEMRLSPS